jgi:hypothetical protein
MQYTRLIVGLLCCAAALTATDSYVGKWKLNLAKSNYKQGTPPKEQIVTMMEVGKDLTVRVDAVVADGSRTVVYYTIPLEGGNGKMFETSPAYDGISGEHIGPNERAIIRWKDGKEVFTARSTVSRDGNTMVGVTKGVSPLGKPVEANLFYEKIK